MEVLKEEIRRNRIDIITTSIFKRKKQPRTSSLHWKNISKASNQKAWWPIYHEWENLNIFGMKKKILTILRQKNKK